MTDRPAENRSSRILVSVWRYRVRAAKTNEFLRAYGPDGEWVQLFRRGEGYISTELLRDTTDPTVFMTIDRWESRAAYDTFRKEFAAEYLARDSICSSFTEDEELLLEGSCA